MKYLMIFILSFFTFGGFGEDIEGLVFKKETEEIYALPKVNILAKKPVFNIAVISQEILKNAPVRNVSEALETLPSIFLTQGGEFIQSSVPSVAGSGIAHTKIIIDGIELNTQMDGTTDLSAFPSINLQKIETAKGALSPLWGSAMGGAIFLHTKNLEKESYINVISSYGSFHTSQTSFDTSFALDRLKFVFIPTYAESGGYQDGGESKRMNYFFKSSYKLNENILMKIISGYSDADIHEYNQSRFFRRTELDAKNMYYGMKLDFDSLLFNEYLSGTVLINGLNNESEREYYLLETNILYDTSTVEESRIGAKANISFTGSNNIFLFEGNADSYKLESSSFRGEKDLNSYYLSTHFEHQLNNDISGQINLRYDGHESFDNEFSYGAGVTFNDIKGFDLSLLISHDFNAPPLIYRYIDQPLRMLKSNNDLNAETGNTIQLSLEKSFKDKLFIQINGYMQKLKDGILLTQDRDDFYFYKNFDSINRKGIEANISFKPSAKTVFNIGGAFNDVVDNKTDKTVSSRGRIKYTTSLQTELSDNWVLSITGFYVWWNMDDVYNAKDRNFVFNSKVSYKLNENFSAYFAVYNIFNADQYWVDVFPNPQRNCETGIKLKL